MPKPSRHWKLATGCTVAWFLLALLVATSMQAQTDTLPEQKPAAFVIGGYLKDLQSATFTTAKGSLLTGNFLHNRLNLKYNCSSTLSARLELRTRVFWGEQVRWTPNFAKIADYENGMMDLSWNPVQQPALVWHTIADRLLLNWQYRRWDITAGRQRVNWGITTAWNPNDLFNAFNFFDFDYEERPGSDALRLRYASSGMSGFDLALSKEKPSNTTIAALLYRFNHRGYDVQLLGAWYKTDLALGAGWAGNLGEAGFKGEATWFQPRRDTTGALAVVLESNYSFEDGWYVGGSFLYASNGSKEVQDLALLAGQQRSAKTLMPFRYSILGQVVKQATPLLTFNLSLIYCPGPDALIFFPVVAYSLSDNWDINLIAQSFFAPTAHKFKNQGNSVLFRLKWGF